MSAKALLTLAPPMQAAALLAFMVNPNSARDRSTWLELHRDLPDAGSVFEAVQSLRHDERLPLWEKLAGQLSGAPLETRQDLVSDARELLRMGGRTTVLRRLLWVCQRHLLNGQAATANAAPDAQAVLPERLGITHALAACCFAAWISEAIPQPELTLDLSELSTVNDRWWQAVTAPWRAQHDEKDLRLPHRDKVDSDLALRSLRVLQELPPQQAAGLLEHWLSAALELLPPDTTLHPVAGDTLRLTANLLKVAMPQGLRPLFSDEPALVVQAVQPVKDVVSAAQAAAATADISALTVELPSQSEQSEQMNASVEAPVEEAQVEPNRAPAPSPQPAVAAAVLVAPPPPALPVHAQSWPVSLPPTPTPAPLSPPESPMDRPFSAVSRPQEVAFVFKAALLHLPGDPDYPDSDSTNSPDDESQPPSA